MRKKLFAIGVISLLAFLCAPLGALAQTGASVTGSVTDETGAPIAGVTVTLKGPTFESTGTDAKGAFSFANVTPGVYVVSAVKPGYTAAVQNDVSLLTGETTTLAFRMSAVSFSSLRTIASVRTNGHALNTSPASVNVVTTQDFIDQGQPQVTRVLSQIPGLQISFPSNSANAAAPGAITVPNIRDAESYETASLIDGHPISVGQYGDNVTTFLNAFMFGNIEVVKGPGADAPVVNNAIGGTVNFQTKDPTLQPYAQMLFGVDNHGGTLSNLDASDTIGRLGFVVDLATDNNPSAFFGKSVYYTPAGAGGVVNGTPLGDPDQYYGDQVGNTQSYVPNRPQLLACCWTLDGSMDQTAELVKLQYKFNSSTRLTLSYLGGQTTSDQNGNTGNFYNAIFSPGPGYTGSLPAGTPIQYASIYPGAMQGEFNNEPIYEAEFSTALGKSSIAARYYNATISRYQWGGRSPAGYDYNLVTLYGTSSDYGGNGYLNATFNGSPTEVQYYDTYEEPELDKLQGESLEWQEPLANNALLTLSGDWTAAQSTDYSIYSGPFYSFALPPGTHQQLGTYMARGQFYVGPKLSATLADYFNTYSSTYPLSCTGSCNTQAAAVNGTGVLFGTTTNSHNDPRLGLVYRPSASTAIRFSLGSSIAPPFLGLLSGVSSPPVYNSQANVAVESVANSDIKPETAWGYDLGEDWRMPNQTVVSGDVYMTNLFNRFFGQTIDTGLTCGQTNDCTGTGFNSSTRIVNQTNTNISNARFEGIELSVNRTPALGFGYTVEGSVNRGYFYDLPPYFYCSLGAAQPGGCIPANYDQNVNVVAGQNTNGIPVDYYGAGISYNGNMRIPYAQANASLSYTFRNSTFVEIGDTYYGKNNSLNEPPFQIGYATVRFPLSRVLQLQVSGDNIFNTYPGYLPVYGAGVPIDLANGQTAATNGNVLGPATWRLILSTR
jgi:outer membrane receptor protein involved in Fe transport